MNVFRVYNLALRKIQGCHLRQTFNQTIQNNVRGLYFSRLKTSLDTPQINKRKISTVEAKQLQKDDSLIKRVLRNVPFLNLEKSRLMASAYLLYENVADKVNYIEFFEQLDLPDTFYSWFVITELHIWMLSVRVMAEGDDGRLVRNYLVEALWNDVAQRIKKLGGGSNPSIAREQVAELSEQLQAALIAYDEGLQTDDAILAGALWRRFYQQQDIDPRYLDILVKYVRKQMRLLDHLSQEALLRNQKFEWIALKQ